MPLKKQTTASSVLITSKSSDQSSTTKTSMTTTGLQPPMSSSPKSANASPSPNNRSQQPPSQQQNHLNSYLISLTECLPSQQTQSSNLNTSTSSAASSSSLSSSPPPPQSAASSSKHDKSAVAQSSHIPDEIRSRLYAIFGQIEREFDLIYAENMKLRKESKDLNDVAKSKNEEASMITNNSSTSTLVAPLQGDTQRDSFDSAVKSSKSSFSQKDSQSSQIVSGPVLNPTLSGAVVTASGGNNKTVLNQQIASLTSQLSHSLVNTGQSAKSALLSSKTRINNLSFPKFKPNNARDFIMQSIKNSKALKQQQQQLHDAAVMSENGGATSNHSYSVNSKLQFSLQGHKDGIWDISCVQIPDHLVNKNNTMPFGAQNTSVLLGTASADNTARLWYFNSQQNLISTKSNGNHQLMSPLTTSRSQQRSIQSAGFCVQEYCGHSGSVNSIRFHPKFFTEATNLILTSSGDCQAHIWQSVLAPHEDSLDSSSECALNYSNCYSAVCSNYYNQTAVNYSNALSPTSLTQSTSCPSTSSQVHMGSVSSPASSYAINYYQDLVSNTAIIRSPIRRYEGHSDACIAAEWFPDGELLATASWDRTANVYNVETGKILCNLQHDDHLTNVSIHRTHKIILTASKDTTFKIWDFRDPICSVQIYQGHNRSVNSAIFVNDDKIATASDDQTVKLWDVRIMRSPVCTIHVNCGVNRLCAIQTNIENNLVENETTYLCLPMDNRDIKVYSLSGERVARFPRNSSRGVGHKRLVTSVTSCGNMVFSASFDKIVNCWSLDYTRSKSFSLTTSHSKALLNINKENNTTNNDPTINNATSSSPPPNTTHKSASIGSSGGGNGNNNNQLAMSSSSSIVQSAGTASTTPVNGSTTITQQQQLLQQSPLNHITNSGSFNNNNKGMNPLSKLAERIKI